MELYCGIYSTEQKKNTELKTTAQLTHWWMFAVCKRGYTGFLYSFFCWFSAAFSVPYTRSDLMFLTISIRFDYQFLGIKRSSGKMAALKNHTGTHSKKKIEANVKRAHNRQSISINLYFFFTLTLSSELYVLCNKCRAKLLTTRSIKQRK